MNKSNFAASSAVLGFFRSAISQTGRGPGGAAPQPERLSEHLRIIAEYWGGNGQTDNTLGMDVIVASGIAATIAISDSGLFVAELNSRTATRALDNLARAVEISAKPILSSEVNPDTGDEGPKGIFSGLSCSISKIRGLIHDDGEDLYLVGREGKHVTKVAREAYLNARRTALTSPEALLQRGSDNLQYENGKIADRFLCPCLTVEPCLGDAEVISKGAGGVDPSPLLLRDYVRYPVAAAPHGLSQS
ncbi:hypothetical protein ACFOY8_15000 [Thalassospira xianhensis]|uniref:hypothetical protein n=1 Tax=Thalassospira xianhensis TaxID=478503 RepID=UPI0011BFBD09|nr:hypothetical protein [Thalassospira xianhensis]